MIRAAAVLQRFVNLSHAHQFLKVEGFSVDFYRKGQILSQIQDSMGVVIHRLNHRSVTNLKIPSVGLSKDFGETPRMGQT